jgi:hypothetical protein
MTYPTKYRRIKFFEEWLSASEIARRHGLSPPTVLRRYAQGLRDRDLVAEAYSRPKAEEGHAFKYRSLRPPTSKEAAYRLRKAERQLVLAGARLASAKTLGESRLIIERLERALNRAEIRHMYMKEMTRRAA